MKLMVCILVQCISQDTGQKQQIVLSKWDQLIYWSSLYFEKIRSLLIIALFFQDLVLRLDVFRKHNCSVNTVSLVLTVTLWYQIILTRSSYSGTGRLEKLYTHSSQVIITLYIKQSLCHTLTIGALLLVLPMGR